MPRTSTRPSTFALASLLLLLCVNPASARQTTEPRDPLFDFGVSLYKLGDYKGAVDKLRAVVKREPGDHAAWLFLGRALAGRGELKDARKAFETAVRLKPDSAAAHAGLAHAFLLDRRPREAEGAVAKALSLDPLLSEARYVVGLLRLHEGALFKARDAADTVIRFDPDFAPAYALKTRVLFRLHGVTDYLVTGHASDLSEAVLKKALDERDGMLKEAAESLETYVRLSPNAPDVGALRDELGALRFYAEEWASGDPVRRIYTARTAGLTPVKIRSKPEPGFTDDARQNNIAGTVRLRAVLGADGSVKHVVVVRALSHGLTEKAVEAARRIKFNPATLGGRPVSQYVWLEYNFNVY